MLDEFTKSVDSVPVVQHGPVDVADSKAIGFHQAQFTWAATSTPGAVTPSRRNFVLRIDGDVRFKPAALNLVVGPTGSGKTSILLALLGEMHFNPVEIDSWYNLPRDGGIAFCPQEAWVLNETIKVSDPLSSEY